MRRPEPVERLPVRLAVLVHVQVNGQLVLRERRRAPQELARHGGQPAPGREGERGCRVAAGHHGVIQPRRPGQGLQLAEWGAGGEGGHPALAGQVGEAVQEESLPESVDVTVRLAVLRAEVLLLTGRTRHDSGEGLAAETICKQGSQRESTRVNESRRESTRVDESRRESTRVDESRRESTRVDESRRESTRVDESRRESTRVDESRRESTRVDESRRESTRVDESRRESTRVDESRRESTRVDESRRESTRVDESRRESTRVDESRRESTRVDESQRESTRVNESQRESTRVNESQRESTRVNESQRESTRGLTITYCDTASIYWLELNVPNLRYLVVCKLEKESLLKFVEENYVFRHKNDTNYCIHFQTLWYKYVWSRDHCSKSYKRD